MPGARKPQSTPRLNREGIEHPKPQETRRSSRIAPLHGWVLQRLQKKHPASFLAGCFGGVGYQPRINPC
ncbi:MAG: hypothetical protein DWH82_04415 [Planctomycetota bacterium]|nr:MAG: hypothetical protein DWH82_04415 [Planctomycetota bacterium]